MKSSLMIIAVTVVALNAQTDITQPPQRLLTADEVLAGGGAGSCRWITGLYGECSATCAETQTRGISCLCILSSTEDVRATSDNCDRDDLRLEPINSRSCGLECPHPTTQPPSPATQPPHPACIWTTGNYLACTQSRAVECRCTLHNGVTITVSDDVCDNEAPRIKPPTTRSCEIERPRRPPPPTATSPAICEGTQTRAVTCVCVLQTGRTTTVSDDVCDSEDPRVRPQTTRSCGIACLPECEWVVGPFSECSATCEGIQERSVTCQCTPSTGSTIVSSGSGACGGDEPSASRRCGEDCPPVCTWNAGRYSTCSATCEGTQTRAVTCVCVLRTGRTTRVSDDVCDSEDPRVRLQTTRSCGIECPPTTEPPTTEGPRTPEATREPRECNLTECQDQRDCDEDECCLEVTRKQYKRHENHNYNSTTFCFPHVDVDEACDLNGNWSCPCRDGLNCTERGRSRGKGKAKRKKDHSKDYRPKVAWKEGEECPTLYKKSNKKPNKGTPTCQEESRRRSGRATIYDEEDEEKARPIASELHWNK